MKNSFKVIIFLFIWSIITIRPIYAQNLKKTATGNETPKITPLEKNFIKIFSRSDPSRILKDSVAMYAINFKIDVIKDKHNKTSVTKITANDSLGYILFPQNTELKKLDYTELFLAGEKKISIIMPILIYMHTEKDIKYRDTSGKPLISLQSAANTAFHLYTDFPYSNLKEGQVTYPRYAPELIKSYRSVFTRRIIVEPMIFDLNTIYN